ncbi:hypothetical protein KVR801_140050 [Klebsiella variicola]|nr:hypothetical protein KVR801_140050 [Klebsiella variicola]
MRLSGAEVPSPAACRRGQRGDAGESASGVPFRDKDTLLYPDIHALRALIHQGELSAMLQALCEEE